MIKARQSSARVGMAAMIAHGVSRPSRQANAHDFTDATIPTICADVAHRCASVLATLFEQPVQRLFERGAPGPVIAGDVDVQ